MSTTAEPATAIGTTNRLRPLDALRGLIMVVMALDHANGFIARQHSSQEMWGGPLPHYDSALAFLTRYITHLAAPGFALLMGVSMVLFAASRQKIGWSDWKIAKHYLVRGLLLFAVQQGIEYWAWAWGIPALGRSGFTVILGVLFSLAGSMIVAALLLPLSTPVLALLGTAAILGTQWLIPVPGAFGQPFPLWEKVLLVPGFAPGLMVFYPLVPWLGITLWGLVLGRAFAKDTPRTVQRLPLAGLGLLLVFLLVRLGGGFGNIHPSDRTDWIGFLYATKYPPSLAFISMSLGVDLLLLAAMTRLQSLVDRFGGALYAFGQSPMFFYIAHLYLYAAIGNAIAPDGMSLTAMYPFWIAGLVVLYPLCRWYGAFKQRQSAESFWRFF